MGDDRGTKTPEPGEQVFGERFYVTSWNGAKQDQFQQFVISQPVSACFFKSFPQTLSVARMMGRDSFLRGG